MKESETRKKRYVFFRFFMIFLIPLCLFSNLAQQEKSSKRLVNSLARADLVNAINISNSGADSRDPRIVADALGGVYVVWIEGGKSGNIFFNSNASGSWRNATNITNDVRIGASGPWPDFVMDTKGNLHLVYTAVSPAPNYEIYYNSYRDGGWSDSRNVSQTPTGGSANPTIGIDPNNFRHYIVWIDDTIQPDRWHLFLTDKEENASQWNKYKVLPFSASAYLPAMDFDNNGEAHLIWIKRGRGSSIVWYSSNVNPEDENKWTEPVAISGQTQEDFCEPDMCVDDGGNAYVAWINNNGGNKEIYFRSFEGGEWGNIENVSKTGGVSLYPRIAVDNFSRTVYVVWQERVNNKWQIYLVYYQGGIWSSKTALTNNSSDSTKPSVSVDGIGKVHIVYADNFLGNNEIMYLGTTEVASVLYPPLEVVCRTQIDDQPDRKKNILTWKKNPENDNSIVQNYRIYRKEKNQNDSSFERIATVSKETFRYDDRNLTTNKKYSYYLTTRDNENRESGPSQIAEEPSVFPPAEVALQSKLDGTLTRKINVLTWKEDPRNGSGDVKTYRIYRKIMTVPGSVFEFLNTVAGSVFKYEDRNLPTDQKYAYYMTATDQNGLECEASAAVYEEIVFPPHSITLKTIVNDSMFFTEKINLIRWNSNPLNDAVTVKKYIVYRKKKNQNDSFYQLLASLSQDGFEYLDRDIPLDDKFSYAVTAVDQIGNESKKSGAVSEK